MAFSSIFIPLLGQGPIFEELPSLHSLKVGRQQFITWVGRHFCLMISNHEPWNRMSIARVIVECLFGNSHSPPWVLLPLIRVIERRSGTVLSSATFFEDRNCVSKDVIEILGGWAITPTFRDTPSQIEGGRMPGHSKPGRLFRSGESATD
jgi:hypothetical protein